MAKTLRVIDSFLFMEVGDTFEFNPEINMYVAEHNEEFHKSDDNDSELRSVYNSNFSISSEYAKELLNEGYLEEVTENKNTRSFVNIFDEIDRLYSKYDDELKNIDEDMDTAPECLKVERTTVLSNMLKLLNHLKGLKK